MSVKYIASEQKKMLLDLKKMLLDLNDCSFLARLAIILFHVIRLMGNGKRLMMHSILMICFPFEQQ